MCPNVKGAAVKLVEIRQERTESLITVVEQEEQSGGTFQGAVKVVHILYLRGNADALDQVRSDFFI